MERSTRARRTDPETSHEAGNRLTTEKLTTAQSFVLGMFRIHGPMYDAQLVERVHDTQKSMKVPEDNWMSPSGVRSRRAELSAPNMARLDELMIRWATEARPRALGEWTVELLREELDVHEMMAAGAFARMVLRSEGFRSPLWDSGRRVKVKGSNVIVWEVAV